MTYRAEDFLTLRARILMNIVLNKLLTATLLDSHSPIAVGSSLMHLDGKLKKMMNKGPKTKFPQYILADIIVTLNTSVSIGYIYGDFPPVIKQNITRPGDNIIVCLKRISAYICQTYSLHAAKADKVFSDSPDSLRILLECEGISYNYWKTGFSKKLKGACPDDITPAELQNYRKVLENRLNDWRNFNKILIGLIKNGRFEISVPEFGSFTVEKAPLDTRMSCLFESAREITRILEVPHYKDFNPIDWEKANYAVDIFTLRKLFHE